MNNHIDLIVGKDIAYAAKQGGGTIAGHEELDQLDLGAVAIFTENNVLVTAATPAAALANVKSFYIAAGRTGDVKKTQLIDRDAFHRLKCAYVAPVLQVSHVGNDGGSGSLNLPAPPYVANEELEVVVYVRQPGIEPAVAKQRHSISTKASDTQDTLITRLVDKINAQSKYVDAVKVGAGVGIELTAKMKNMTFEVAVNGILEDADITYTTPATFSQGDADDVKAQVEQDAQIYDGDTSSFWYSEQLFNQPSEIVAGAQYVCYWMSWEAESRNSVNSHNSKVLGATAYFPDGAGVIATVDTILGLLVTAIPSTGSGTAPFTSL